MSEIISRDEIKNHIVSWSDEIFEPISDLLEIIYNEKVLGETGGLKIYYVSEDELYAGMDSETIKMLYGDFDRRLKLLARLGAIKKYEFPEDPLVHPYALVTLEEDIFQLVRSIARQRATGGDGEDLSAGTPNMPDEKWPDWVKMVEKELFLGKYGRIKLTSDETFRIVRLLVEAKGAWVLSKSLRDKKDKAYLEATISQLRRNIQTKTNKTMTISSTRDSNDNNTPRFSAYRFVIFHIS